MRLRLPFTVTIFGLAASLVLFSSAYAQSTLEGTIGADGRSYNVNGSNAKAHEYTDLRSSGVFGNVDMKYDSPGYFLNFLARDPGYDTQQYRLDTGAYGKFKLMFDYNEIIHNITSDAKTFYNGVGSGNLTGAANANPNSWASTFDYFTKRKKLDMGLKFDMAKPFFLNIDYSHEKKEGLKPTGVSSSGTTGPSVELPEPIDYRTDGIKVEGGYSKNPYFVSFSYFYNEFRNSIGDLNFTPVGANPGPLSLPPDNKFHKFALKGSAKLPWNSKFTMNLGDAKATSDATNFTRFDGKVNTANYDFMLTSNPFRFLDAKIYYKYYERDNKSSGQVLVNGAFVNTNPLYYKTETLGAELGFKLPIDFYLNGGYKNVYTKREVVNETDPGRFLPYNTDNIYFANVKWNKFDRVTPRVGYERMERSADYQSAESENVLNRKFAYAAQNKDTFKAAVDVVPVDNLNFSLEYRYKKSDYKDTGLGVTSDSTDAFGFNADYTIQKIARIYGYFDYEKGYLYQRATSPSFWESKQDETTYSYGLRTDVYAIPKKLTIVVQADYLRTTGTNNFAFYDNAIWGTIGVPQGSLVNIPNSDSYQRYSLGISGVYNWSESLMVRAGYTYARYIFSDAQLNGYQYVPNGGVGTNGAYLTGAYANPSYSANIVHLGLAYKFK